MCRASGAVSPPRRTCAPPSRRRRSTTWRLKSVRASSWPPRDAVERRVDLLGSGPTELGTPVDWLCDFKTGRRWEPAYARRIEYANLDEPSDVKVPWELSRMQWLIPAAQAYALTGDERYADRDARP